MKTTESFVILFWMVNVYALNTDLKWYPEVRSRVEMANYLNNTAAYMTTASVFVLPKSQQIIIGSQKSEYKFTECIADIFKRNRYGIQLQFVDLATLAKVVDILLVRDDARLWVHVDMVQGPGAQQANRDAQELNRLVVWQNIVLSVGWWTNYLSASGGLPFYTLKHAADMVRVLSQPNVANATSVLVIDGYLAQLQPNFIGILGPLENASDYILLRIAPDREDKVVIAVLNATIHELGGRRRVLLDCSQRLRSLSMAASNYNYNPDDPDAMSSVPPCSACRPVIIRKFARSCAGFVFHSTYLCIIVTLIIVGWLE